MIERQVKLPWVPPKGEVGGKCSLPFDESLVPHSTTYLCSRFPSRSPRGERGQSEGHPKYQDPRQISGEHQFYPPIIEDQNSLLRNRQRCTPSLPLYSRSHAKSCTFPRHLSCVLQQSQRIRTRKADLCRMPPKTFRTHPLVVVVLSGLDS